MPIDPDYSLPELADGLYSVLVEREQDAMSVRFHYTVMSDEFTGVLALGDEDVLEPDEEPDEDDGLDAIDPEEVDTLTVAVERGRATSTVTPDDAMYMTTYDIAEDEDLRDAFLSALFDTMADFFRDEEIRERADGSEWFGVA
jgi:hypothetical protein